MYWPADASSKVSRTGLGGSLAPRACGRRSASPVIVVQPALSTARICAASTTGLTMYGPVRRAVGARGSGSGGNRGPGGGARGDGRDVGAWRGRAPRGCGGGGRGRWTELVLPPQAAKQQRETAPAGTRRARRARVRRARPRRAAFAALAPAAHTRLRLRRTLPPRRAGAPARARSGSARRPRCCRSPSAPRGRARRAS